MSNKLELALKNWDKKDKGYLHELYSNESNSSKFNAGKIPGILTNGYDCDWGYDRVEIY